MSRGFLIVVSTVSSLVSDFKDIVHYLTCAVKSVSQCSQQVSCFTLQMELGFTETDKRSKIASWNHELCCGGRMIPTAGSADLSPLLAVWIEFSLSVVSSTNLYCTFFPATIPCPTPLTPHPPSVLAVRLGGDTGAVSYQQSHCASAGHSDSHAGGAHRAWACWVGVRVTLVGVGAHVTLELRGCLTLHSTQLAE